MIRVNLRKSIGVARYGKRSPRLPTIIFPAQFRNRTKSITANSIRFSIRYRFENVWNWRREAFYHAYRKHKIAFVFGWDTAPVPLREFTTLPLIPQSAKDGIPIPILNPVDAFGVSVSAPRFVPPRSRTQFWRRHWEGGSALGIYKQPLSANRWDWGMTLRLIFICFKVLNFIFKKNDWPWLQ